MDRTGDVFIVPKQDWQLVSIQNVLRLRRQEVRSFLGSSQGNEEAVILDTSARVRVEKILYQQYCQEADTWDLRQQVWERAQQLAAERKAQGERSSQHDIYNRNMRSYWKTTVFNRYGGEVWLSTLIATGRVHRISVDIVNEICADRIRNQAKREPTGDHAMAPPSTVARASSQGQVRGVQHKKPHSNNLRQQAKHADKQIKWNEQNRWEEHHRRGWLSARRNDWYFGRGNHLKRVADRLWERALQESFARGVAFQGRDGTMQHPSTPQLGTVERSLQILRERIQKGEVTWPPS